MVILRPSFLFVWTVCAVLRWAGLVDSWLPPPLGLLIVLWPRPTGCFFPLLPDWGFRPPLPEKFTPPEKKKWNKNRGKVVLEEKKSSRSLTGKQIRKFQIPTWASNMIQIQSSLVPSHPLLTTIKGEGKGIFQGVFSNFRPQSLTKKNKSYRCKGHLLYLLLKWYICSSEQIVCV